MITAQPDQKQTSTQIHCFHCVEPCKETTIHLEEKAFCCEGCKLLYEILNENNLCNYYDVTQSSGNSPDYYAKELVFQDQIEKEQRSRALTEDVSFMMGSEQLDIQFPREMKSTKISGNVQLFCPVDAKKDISFAIEADSNGKQIIPLNQVKAGRYKLQISWKANGLEYYKENVIVRN